MVACALLVAAKADPDLAERPNGRTPLYAACERNSVRAANFLISIDADVNVACPPNPPLVKVRRALGQSFDLNRHPLSSDLL